MELLSEVNEALTLIRRHCASDSDAYQEARKQREEALEALGNGLLVEAEQPIRRKAIAELVLIWLAESEAEEAEKLAKQIEKMMGRWGFEEVREKVKRARLDSKNGKEQEAKLYKGALMDWAMKSLQRVKEKLVGKPRRGGL